MNAEKQRLEEDRLGSQPWRKWGPYLSERQWGTVREDCTADGNAWNGFPHDHARSRAYRWGEDGLAGLCDGEQYLCLALALWNGKDPILKERLFGLTNSEGNHGEDVKELYYYLDATPTHSYLKMLYKYPQRAFPYDRLVEENRRRGRQDPEFELLDTGIFDDDRYFDVFVEYAKAQLLLLTREWYMHPNGQLPAYEWNFGDVNPPVHAWAAFRVFQIDRKQRGDHGDLGFLERVFHKLMLNFTWWVNRKDPQGRNVFQGGFLGLDNIGVFDRSTALPTGGSLDQADGTAWMAMYCLNLMRIALELALHNHAYEDIATKFFEHFLSIAEAMVKIGADPAEVRNARGQVLGASADGGVGMWDEGDEFYHDVLNLPDGRTVPLEVRSLVGLIPLLAVQTLEPEVLAQLPDFSRRLRWILKHRPGLSSLVSRWHEPGRGERRLLSLLRGYRMKCLLRRALDETEFL